MTDGQFAVVSVAERGVSDHREAICDSCEWTRMGMLGRGAVSCFRVWCVISMEHLILPR